MESVTVTPPVVQDPSKPVEGVETVNGGIQVTDSQQQKPPVADPNRPAWLPEKFKSAEEMAKAYGELEAKQGKPPETPKAPTQDEAVKLVADAGLDMAKLASEYAEKGALSAETMTTLAAKGITQEHVKQFVEGQQAKAANLMKTFSEVVGGEDTLKSLLDWAKTGLSAEEIAAYNSAIDTNEAAAQTYLRGMHAKYVASQGQDPKLISAEPVTSKGVAPFNSNVELTDAMSDPRYRKDPAFRLLVTQRLNASKM